jgi:hypothetical protein
MAPAAPEVALPRRVRPNGFNVLDPAAIVARSPSGRVVVTSPHTALGSAAPPAPYAPPSIQIIGAASARHMRGPVHLTHGVAPTEELDTKPRVIWLKDGVPGASAVKGAE